MARSKSEPSEPKRYQLVKPREEAKVKIQIQIDKGNDLLNEPVSSSEILIPVREAYYRWSNYSEELLRSLFDTDVIAKNFRGLALGLGGDLPFDEALHYFHNEISYKVNELRSVFDKLDLIDESPLIRSLTKSSVAVANKSNKVFIIHGHDEEAMHAVARFVEKLGLQAVILAEQPNRGRTIIEKFEGHAEDAAYAIALLTPDDVGASKNNQANLLPRARQNVILELGYFAGKLGRSRVCALHKGDLEIPSDFSGVVWTLMDSHDGWKFLLAKEMKESGLQIDLNKAI